MASPASVTPTFFQQVFENGDACTGVAYEGTADVLRVSAAFPERDGRVYRQEKDGGDPAIDGGLFLVGSLRPRAYNRLSALWAKLPGCTVVAAYAVDEDGVTYLIATSATDTLVLTADIFRDLLPGWSVKVVGTGAITGAGVVTLIFSEWGQPVPFFFA